MIQQLKLLTVITVVKDDDKRLKVTLKSLEKFYESFYFEHIIVENINKKVNLSLSNKLKKNPRLVYINDNGHNNGIYNAMNIGIKKATSRYILFLNAGDKLISSADLVIDILKMIIEKYSFGNIIFFNSYLNYQLNEIILIPNENFSYTIPTSHQAMFFKSTFLKKNKFNLNYNIASDFDMVLKSTKHDLVFLKNEKPITSIEYGGFSSKNYIKSYYEYFKIININKSGYKKFKDLLFLLIRFVIVFFFKSFFKEKTLFELKRKIYKCYPIIK